MEQLGSDPELRARMAGAARCRALAFDWPRYHDSLVAAVEDVLGSRAEPDQQNPPVRSRSRLDRTGDLLFAQPTASLLHPGEMSGPSWKSSTSSMPRSG